ncbi:TetR/AcrR family transcriptional regulator [Gymnodinialimonas ceratoperidinii]|uniref:TetR/AcrR family transcriptional regulator n=1 Tax=Gymnodinialimonas ceratoperidinii TaxID=2856823 RepID=A0A8F6TUL7_9RHOB|nr:TetR/AcrR family transcriptional regulator [Gymnodinialimonas ceratoperidinii]QXT38159.1 TetR/AcrR family transcriptional regulator [Gymnodinialimonas ceratoperidinii]
MPRAANYDREAALDAAMDVFWRKGYHATSLKDLEAALAMKPGSIYAAFDSKEALYLLAMERYFEMSRAAFEAQVEKADTPLAGLAAQFRSYAALAGDGASRKACMLMKTIIDTSATDPQIAEASQRHLDEMCAAFARVFEAAQARGDLPAEADPKRLARRYQANISALRVELLRGTEPDQVAMLADDMAHEVMQLSSPA